MRDTDASSLLGSLGRDGAQFIVVHDYPECELANPTNGSSRLVAEFIRSLKRDGWDTRSVRWSSMGGTRAFFRRMHEKAWRIMSGPADRTRGRAGALRETMSALYLATLLFDDLIERLSPKPPGFDDAFRVTDGRKQVVIHHFSLGSRAIHKHLGKEDTIFIVYEHNVDWIYHMDKIPGAIYGILISWMRKTEMASLADADYVFCLNKGDCGRLVKEGAGKEKIRLWMPPIQRGNERRVAATGNDGFVIGFVGTDSDHNIVAVENIMSIAEELGDGFAFKVIGSVGRAFSGRVLPRNVRLTGYLNDLGTQLSGCDAFINPKTTSETGSEMKMLDYLAWDRPIITTESGLSGFEGGKKFIVCDVRDMAGKIRMLREAKWRWKGSSLARKSGTRTRRCSRPMKK